MRKPWSPEELAYIREHYADMNTLLIVQHIQTTFLSERSYSSVSQAARNMGIKKSLSFLASEASGRLQKKGHRGHLTQFKKGQAPLNKGKKQIEFMSAESIERTKATRFKKGNLPHNTKTDSQVTIRTDKRGVKNKFIRVQLGKWVPLQRYNWEKVHGPIPKGYKVIFKDGDTMNCDVSNLECLTAAELMKRNSFHNYPKPLAQLVQLRGALNRQINKHQKRLNNEK